MAPPKGFHHGQETKEKIGAAQKGRHPSAETRRRLSAARKGWVYSPETRAKISATMCGRKLPPETKALMSIAQKKRWSLPAGRAERKRQSAFMRGKKYAYKPYLHLTQEEMRIAYNAYVREHGEKPYPVISHPVVLTRDQIEERLVSPRVTQKPVGNPAPKSRKGSSANISERIIR